MQQLTLKKTELAKAQPVVENTAAIIILGVSIVGSLLWGAGGWERLRNGEGDWVGLVAALCLQLLCSGVQYIYAERVFSPQYLASLGLSSATTVMGYWPLTSPILSAWIAPVIPAPLVVWATGALLTLIAVLADTIPERRFVR